jgi:hypothetical protein
MREMRSRCCGQACRLDFRLLAVRTASITGSWRQPRTTARPITSAKDSGVKCEVKDDRLLGLGKGSNSHSVLAAATLDSMLNRANPV